jgi:alkanesulfonate monooxygenase SsuD/methylene tetrahydromethanopterin reductase-like flavin-dependent oxidoreductase (luciferase family)
MKIGAAAAVTKTSKLGTGVCLVVRRDPIQTAKEVATVDRLSNGRLLFGIGGGWNAEEMADHGTAFGTRFKLMRERIEGDEGNLGAPEAKIQRRARQVR